MSGVGRGRGWLNIKREQQTLGGTMATTTIVNEEDTLKKFMGYIENITEIPPKYSKAFHYFETISDEQILLRNLTDHHFTEQDIYQCIIMLVQKYLVQWNMDSNAIENALKIDRKAVLNSAQNLYENREYLFKRNKQAFVKLIVMLSRFYAVMGVPFLAMAVFNCGPFILYPVHNDYVTIFAKCLHQVLNTNNTEIKAVLRKDHLKDYHTAIKHKKLEDSHGDNEFGMLTVLRAAICSTSDEKTRYWLYLIRDMWHCGVQILPEETLTFYAQHLGQAEVNYFRQAPDLAQPLYLDTNQSTQSLEQFVSGVSVLKIDDSPSTQEGLNDANRPQGGASDIVPNSNPVISAAPTEQQQQRNTRNNYPRSSPLISDNPQHTYQPPPPLPAHVGSGRAILGSGARNTRNNTGNSGNKQQKHSPRYDQPEPQVNGWREEQQQHPPPPNRHQQFVDTGRPPPPDVPRNHSSWSHDDRC